MQFIVSISPYISLLCTVGQTVLGLKAHRLGQLVVQEETINHANEVQMTSGPKRDCLTHHVTMVLSCFFVCGKDTHRTTVTAQMQLCQKMRLCLAVTDQLQPHSQALPSFLILSVQTHMGIALSPDPFPPIMEWDWEWGQISSLNINMNALSLPSPCLLSSMHAISIDPSNFCAVNCRLFPGITVGDRKYLLVCQYLRQKMVLCALTTDSGRLVNAHS